MEELIIKNNFIKFNFIKKSIKLVLYLLYDKDIAEMQLNYITALYICKLKGVPYVSEYCAKLLRDNVSSKIKKTDISNYITVLRKMEYIDYKDKVVYFPQGFRKHIGENFKLNLTFGSKK